MTPDRNQPFRTIALGIVLILFGPHFPTYGDEATTPPQPSANQTNSSDIAALITQLQSEDHEQQNAAEQQLLDQAKKTTSAAELDTLLDALPEDNDQMPLAVRERLSRLRRELESLTSRQVLESTTVTLSAKDLPLSEVLAAIEKQTGNKIVDNREQDEDAAPTKVTIELKDEPFWSALDRILDEAKMNVYSYGGDQSLALVARNGDDRSRVGSAYYSGPFRIEATELQSTRNLRSPQDQSLRLQLEVGWEPRLRPISIALPASVIRTELDSGKQLIVNRPEAMLDVEVPGGTQAAELVVPLQLPDREAKSIKSIVGKIQTLVPSRQAKFEFPDWSKKLGTTQRRGGIAVTLENVRESGGIWEVHMRFSVDRKNNAIESNGGGWVFQNDSYLLTDKGERIDNAGFETTRQTNQEIGIAYLFDVQDEIKNATWVYESPAAIVELPIEFELKDIELP